MPLTNRGETTPFEHQAHDKNVHKRRKKTNPPTNPRAQKKPFISHDLTHPKTALPIDARIGAKHAGTSLRAAEAPAPASASNPPSLPPPVGAPCGAALCCAIPPTCPALRYLQKTAIMLDQIPTREKKKINSFINPCKMTSITRR